eukprot:scaffold26257_cov63-Phaeocystis_antarctica.AAC.4
MGAHHAEHDQVKEYKVWEDEGAAAGLFWQLESRDGDHPGHGEPRWRRVRVRRRRHGLRGVRCTGFVHSPRAPEESRAGPAAARRGRMLLRVQHGVLQRGGSGGCGDFLRADAEWRRQEGEGVKYRYARAVRDPCAPTCRCRRQPPLCSRHGGAQRTRLAHAAGSRHSRRRGARPQARHRARGGQGGAGATTLPRRFVALVTSRSSAPRPARESAAGCASAFPLSPTSDQVTTYTHTNTGRAFL